MAEPGQDEGDKTEAPSQRKLDEARKKGQIASSREIATFLLFGSATVMVAAMAPGIARDVTLSMKRYLAAAATAPADPAALGTGLTHILSDLGATLTPLLLLLISVPIAAALLQNAVLWSPELLAPKWERVSPWGGLKRLVGPKALLEFGKGLIKLGLIGAAGIVALMSWRDELAVIDRLPAALVGGWLGGAVTSLLTALTGAAALIAALDFAHKRFEFMSEMKMTRREVQDEHKQNEGDPVIKQRLRQIRMAKARQRMMADVPKSTVIITNPTHYAVALRYVPGETAAPKVMALGLDLVALRIREVAKAHNVPIIESPPLARAIYASVEVGEMIPAAHYQAVAEIIGYVTRLNEGVVGRT